MHTSCVLRLIYNARIVSQDNKHKKQKKQQSNKSVKSLKMEVNKKS